MEPSHVAGGLTSAQLLAQRQPVSLYQDIFETEQQSVAEAFQQRRHTLRACKRAENPETGTKDGDTQWWT